MKFIVKHHMRLLFALWKVNLVILFGIIWRTSQLYDRLGYLLQHMPAHNQPGRRGLPVEHLTNWTGSR